MSDTRREAFLGLIAPIGIDLDAVVTAFRKVLDSIKYRTNELRLTDIFKENTEWYDIDSATEIDRYKKLILAGDKFCKDSGRKDILARYGIAQLHKSGDRGLEFEIPSDVVHVFRQLKRVEEIALLKNVYGRNIQFVACYAPKQDRVNYLVNKMLKNERGTGKGLLEARAHEIISTDEEERDEPFGQRVLECFPHADYVLDCTTQDSLVKSIERFVHIFFGSPFIAPVMDEYCSYIANAASYRSLDLSRQVGAAIFNDGCEMIAMGCNEVPRAGGGTYWSDGNADFRDYALGYDSNQKVREDMIRDALVRLQGGDWLLENLKKLKPDEIVAKAISDSSDPIGPLAKSMISDIIEFGRMVHAEMNALTDASRFGRSTLGATLYCTTLPCHMCTKLIIASGIKRVVYVQPYGKSLVGELFPDSVQIDDGNEGKKVKFETLKGVTPNGFKMAFHKRKKRKDYEGRAISWNPTLAQPIFLSTFPYYMPLEMKAIDDFKDALQTASEERKKSV